MATSSNFRIIPRPKKITQPYANPKAVPGSRNGKLVLIKKVGDYHHFRFLCQCDCGNEHYVDANNFWHTRSCGCAKTTSLTPIGKKYGDLTVIKSLGRERSTRREIVKCLCTCGEVCIFTSRQLSQKWTCCPKCNSKKDKRFTHRSLGTPLYKKWRGMVDNWRKQSKVDIDPTFLDFLNFKAVMKDEFIEGYTLVRIDKKKGFWKDNLKWRMPDKIKNRIEEQKWLDPGLNSKEGDTVS